MQWPQTTRLDTDMYNITHNLYKGFQCHSKNVCLFYSSTQPSQFPLYHSPHNNYPAPGCLQIHLHSLYVLLFHTQSSPQVLNVYLMWGCQQLCKLFMVPYLLFIFSLQPLFLWYSCGSQECVDNIKMDLHGMRNRSKEQIKLTDKGSNCGLLCTRWRIFNKSGQCLSAACLSMFISCMSINVYQLDQCFTTQSVSCSCSVQHRYCKTYLLAVSL